MWKMLTRSLIACYDHEGNLALAKVHHRRISYPALPSTDLTSLVYPRH